jgi:hypothetical protein
VSTKEVKRECVKSNRFHQGPSELVGSKNLMFLDREVVSALKELEGSLTTSGIGAIVSSIDFKRRRSWRCSKL